MKMKIIIALVLSLFTLNANSSPFSADWKTLDDGLITRDLNTGLDWLDLNLTQGNSSNQVTSQLEAGGLYEGWRFATDIDISAFWDSFGGDSSKYDGYSVENNGLFDLIAPLWGDMNCSLPLQSCEAGEGYSSVFHLRSGNIAGALMFDAINAARTVNEDLFDLINALVGPDVEDLQFGSALVRDTPAVVPIPAAAWLFGSGLLGLIGMARRKA